MKDFEIAEVFDENIWNNFINTFDFVHGFQLYGWGEVKKAQGWIPIRLAFIKERKMYIALQLLLKKLGWFYAGQVPFGPVGSLEEFSKEEIEIFSEKLSDYCRERKILILLIHPYKKLKLDYGKKIRKANFLLLYSKTFLINLDKSLDEIFRSFNPKTRNQIRKSIKEDLLKIEIDNSEEGIQRFYKLYKETYQYSGAIPLRKNVFEAIANKFKMGKNNDVFFSKFNDKDVSAMIILKSGKTAVYQWAASTIDPQLRKLNAQRRLIWEAIKYYKETGIKYFDLGGIPDRIPFSGTKKFGIYEFKSFFGGEIYENEGTYVISPFPAIFVSMAMKLQELIKYLRGYR